MTNTPHVIQIKILSVEVCVPLDWADYQVVEFTESQCSYGTKRGWVIYQRQPCTEREGMVHIVLNA